MNIMDELLNLKNKLKSACIPSYDLNNKVDEFIDWYANNIIGGEYTDIREHFSIKMRNFIEKIAVWYELRYPDYEVNRIMHCTDQESKKVSDEMFNKNNYINQLFDLDSEVRIPDWDEFYNAKAFINSLPIDEQWYFKIPEYRDIVYWNRNKNISHLHLSKNGTVVKSEMYSVIPGLSNNDFEGKNIKDVVKMINDKGIKFPENSEFIKAINDYDNMSYQKEEMLNCVMYRIIERGGNRIGPRRAFLFAKEFGRNIDIPMMYGVDFSDPGLMLFIDEYIKAGGSKNLKCYEEYFSKNKKNQKLDTISIEKLILIENKNTSIYTPGEKEQYQKLINVLSSRIDTNVVKQEKVKKLRLQRKLEKSKNS